MKKYKIVICGPNTLSAYLQSLHMGFQSLKISKHATEIYDHLKTISTRFSSHFDNIYKLRKKLEDDLEEDKDENLLATALRETQEEVGVQVEVSQVIAQLPIVNTRLGFEITPFVSVFSAAMEFKLKEDEVEEILEIPLTSLLATQQRDVSFNSEQDMVMYWFKHNRIWGASAQILREIMRQ